MNEAEEIVISERARRYEFIREKLELVPQLLERMRLLRNNSSSLGEALEGRDLLPDDEAATTGVPRRGAWYYALKSAQLARVGPDTGLVEEEYGRPPNTQSLGKISQMREDIDVSGLAPAHKQMLYSYVPLLDPSQPSGFPQQPSIREFMLELGALAHAFQEEKQKAEEGRLVLARAVRDTLKRAGADPRLLIGNTSTDGLEKVYEERVRELKAIRGDIVTLVGEQRARELLKEPEPAKTPEQKKEEEEQKATGLQEDLEAVIREEGVDPEKFMSYQLKLSSRLSSLTGLKDKASVGKVIEKAVFSSAGLSKEKTEKLRKLAEKELKEAAKSFKKQGKNNKT